MARVTNNIAEMIVNQMSISKTKEIDSLQRKMLDKIREEFKKKIPKSVLKEYEKHPEYFGLSLYVNVSSSSGKFNSKGFYLSGIPSPQQSSMYLSFLEDVELEKEIGVMYDGYREAVKDHQKMGINLYTAVKSFTTFKKLEEGFPEAYKAIPKDVRDGASPQSKMLPAKNLDPLKKYFCK